MNNQEKIKRLKLMLNNKALKVCPLLNYRYALIEDGRLWSFKNNKFIKSSHSPQGYVLISMWVNNERTTKLLHRLLAMAWLPKINGKNQINHKNGVKDDNRLENLEWVTSSENALHAFKVLGRTPPMKGKLGKLHPLSKKLKQIDFRNGKTVKIWDAVMDVERSGWASSNICRSMKQNKVAYGFKWQYV